jgi:hypothetical protein
LALPNKSNLSLTSGTIRLQYQNYRFGGVLFSMPSLQTQSYPEPSKSRPMNQPCRHPRVAIVAREEDSEFVECLECREVFESSEFKDMEIEDSVSGEVI